MPQEPYPGARLGLPQAGRGSLASWTSRCAAVVLDWGLCMLIAVALFGTGVVNGGGWRAWMVLTVFFVESAVLTAVAGGSLGQLACRIAVIRLDRRPLGVGRALLRAALVCVVLPALVIGADRRGLHDLAAGTVVLNRR